MSNLPGFLQLKNSFRHWQAISRPNEFGQVRQLFGSQSLHPLLAQQPRFPYKYLGSYIATNFARPERLAALLHHYQFLLAGVQTNFFSLLTKRPIIWQEYLADEQFRIELSYPLLVNFEGELSLNLYRGTTLVQMVTFVIVAGELVGGPPTPTLLISQVQGTPQVDTMRLATKQLHDITPASLLINAAYGLAAALGIGYAAGVGSQNQLGRGARCHFDYDAFWQQFRGETLASGFYLLDIQDPEKPLEEVKPKYRQRTLRKRAYKQQVRREVETSFHDHFIASPVAIGGLVCSVAS